MTIYERLVNLGYKPYRYRPEWGQTRWRITVKCISCGTDSKMDYDKVLYRTFTKKCFDCSRVFRNIGKDHLNWKGGRFINSQGYLYIKIYPNDLLYVMGNKEGYVREHRYKIAKKIGRILKNNEHVHHINGIKTDNRIENLELMNYREHLRLHDRKRLKNSYGQYI